tara:strand:- start:32975 stop:37651 length:4677 start_codon:yes stop_codon:yes gene_type:complete
MNNKFDKMADVFKSAMIKYLLIIAMLFSAGAVLAQSFETTPPHSKENNLNNQITTVKTTKDINEVSEQNKLGETPSMEKITVSEKGFQKYLDKWNRSVTVSDMHYDHGAYGLSYGRMRMRVRKDGKKSKTNAFFIIDLAKKAKYLDGKGEFMESTELFDSSLTIMNKYLTPESFYYKRALVEVAEVGNSIGRNKEAYELLRMYDDSLIKALDKAVTGRADAVIKQFVDELKDTLVITAMKKEATDLSSIDLGGAESTANENSTNNFNSVSITSLGLNNDSALFYNFAYVMMKTQKDLGYFQQGLELLSRSVKYHERISKKKLHLVDQSANKNQKIKKKELKKREYHLAKLYLLEAKFLFASGNYPQADSLFERNHKKRIKKLLGEKNAIYLDNLLSYANLKSVQEEYHDAAKLYEKARKKINKTSKVSSSGKLYYGIKEGQTLNYIKLDDYSNFRRSAKEFEDEAKSKYSKKSPYFLTTERVLNQGLYYSHPKKAQRRLRRVYKRLQKQTPKFHVSKIPYNELFFKIKRRNSELNEAKKFLDHTVEIYKENYGENSPKYHLERLKMAQYEINYNNDFRKAEDIFDESFGIAAKAQLHPYHTDYFKLLITYADLFILTDRFSKAEEAVITALAIINKKHGQENKYYGVGLEKLAEIMIKVGDFNRAENLLLKAIDIIKDEEGKKSLDYINAIRTLAELFNINGKNEDAEGLIRQANKLTKKLSNYDDSPNASNAEQLADLYIQTGRYDEAFDLLLKTLDIRYAKYGDDHNQMIQPNLLLGKLFLFKGDFVKAEMATQIGVRIAKEVFSDTSTAFLGGVNLLALVYLKMGDYVKAERIYLDIIEQNKKMFGERSITAIKPATQLAKVMIENRDNNDEILKLLEEIRGIIDENLGKMHPKYAEVLQLESEVFMRKGKYYNAEKTILEARNIWIEKLSKNHVKTADNIMLNGEIQYQKKNYDNAISEFEGALELYESLFSIEHPKYVKTQGLLARSYYAKGDYSRSLKVFDATLAQYLLYIKNYFPALSENEKAKYWNSIKEDFEIFNSLAINFKDQEPEVLQKMYDYKISTKTILLSSMIKIKQRILNSGDQELILAFYTWVGKKEFLTRAISMSNDELKDSGINLEDLHIEINKLEKELSQKSEIFSHKGDEDDLTWKSIQDKLRPGETVIEQIRFRYFDTELTDSVIYANLLVSKSTKRQPKLVVLPNGNDLEGKFFKHYRDMVKYKGKDRYSYPNFWASIDAVVPDGNKVFLSPAGIFSQLNVEVLQDDNEVFMIDKNEFYTISNSKDIFHNRVRIKEDLVEMNKHKHHKDVEGDNIFKSTIILFGNPDFKKGHDGSNVKAIAGRQSSVDPLLGAEKEVTDLEAFMKANHWDTQLYIGADATEDEVKEMESPTVFHLATHGFFIDEDPGAHHSSHESNNPLMKAGLMFTGAASLITEQNLYNLNKQEGILTAYEAMNLHLDNTELVVLSSCETGLGEIKAGEVVLGLQRAFLVAGANNVIMSLFKVNDQATQELMNTFYEEWIKTGDKRKSFIKAKNHIRSKYDEPINWGSFIMIGLD